MSHFTWLSCFIGLWSSVYLVDAALRTHPYTRQWYQEFTTRLGISFDILQARFFTQRLNRVFQFICHLNFVPWTTWFSCGVIFSTVFMVLSIWLLALLAYNTLMRKSIEGQILTPVMPGVNLPFSQMGFYMLTLLLCALLHEAGHALAALHERVRLHGFGVFLFGFYPGAYVDLNTADLQGLAPFNQLRIYCAGVWHNAVIAIFSVLLFYTMPYLLSPGYHTGSGVGVTYLRENSVVTGHRGLSLGDAITRINSCPVANQSDWYRCLEEAHARPSGYCVSGAYLNTIHTTYEAQGPRRTLSAVASVGRSADSGETGYTGTPGDSQSTFDCCSHQSASTHLCFTYSVVSKHGGKSPRYACLPARPVTERATCYSAADCGPQSVLRQGSSAKSGLAESGLLSAASRNVMCVVPSPPDNQTRLVRLVHNRKEAPAILFLGPLDDLLSSVGVSDYVPRWPSILSPNFPVVLSLFCTYLFSLSGALVILNVVPCYALDGQWILKALIDWCLSGCLPCRWRRQVLFKVVMFIGSLLLCTNVFLALWYFILEADFGSTHSTLHSTAVPVGAGIS